MHCKVCESANKSPAVIASHYPKNRGITVCPTLLSQQCRGCGNKGHTIKYCFPVAVVKAVVRTEQVKPERTKPKKETVVATIDLLYVSSDEEEEQEEQKQEEQKQEVKEKRKSKKPRATTTEPKKKFCWADAESDSSGSEDSDSD
jgi:hypothetical protein